MGALSDAQVGEYFAKHFVAAHEQVGDFEVVNIKGTLTKNGGNVASYFCTPEGRVVHAVLGPVTANELLEQAKWAVEHYQIISEHQEVHRQRGILAHAHRSALSNPGLLQGNGRTAMNNNRVHSFLATQKFPTLDSVHQHVFERLLGQRVSNTRDLQVAEEKLLIAKRDSRPILFVLNRSSFGIGTALNKSIGRGPPRNLLPHYMVISLKPKDLPALSRLTKQPPYEVSGVSATTYVVCRSNGEQIGAAVEQNSRDFPKLLAEGLVDNAIRNPPETKKLKMLIRLVDRYDDEGFGDELRQLYQEQISAAKVPTLSDEEVLARALLLE